MTNRLRGSAPRAGGGHPVLLDWMTKLANPFILSLVFFCLQGPFIYIRFTLKPLPTHTSAAFLLFFLANLFGFLKKTDLFYKI